MHARTAFGAFVAHHHNVAGFDLVVQDVLHRLVLRLHHMGRAFKHQQAVVHASGFDHAAVNGDVARQHGQAALLAEGMIHRANAALGAIGVQTRPTGILAERHLGGNASRASFVEGLHGFAGVAGNVPFVEHGFEVFAQNSRHIGV